MENSEFDKNQSSPILVTVIIIAIIGAVIAWQFLGQTESVPEVPSEVTTVEAMDEAPLAAVAQSSDMANDSALEDNLTDHNLAATPEIVPVEIEPLPALNDSDPWLQEKLSTMTWRKELLSLVIDDDMIRRFVIFTDNFARGELTYEHSPLVLPAIKFSALTTEKLADNKQEVWLWDDKSTRRFSLYVDLLRSFDSASLVQWYLESKPLIDQAYQELGYDSGSFTATLQQAINRVLDMEIQKEAVEIIRPNVMYQFKDPAIEKLPDTDKLLLRLGKDNLLVIKSVLLEISEKIARQDSRS